MSLSERKDLYIRKFEGRITDYKVIIDEYSQDLVKKGFEFYKDTFHKQRYAIIVGSDPTTATLHIYFRPSIAGLFSADPTGAEKLTRKCFNKEDIVEAPPEMVGVVHQNTIRSVINKYLKTPGGIPSHIASGKFMGLSATIVRTGTLAFLGRSTLNSNYYSVDELAQSVLCYADDQIRGERPAYTNIFKIQRTLPFEAITHIVAGLKDKSVLQADMSEQTNNTEKSWAEMASDEPVISFQLMRTIAIAASLNDQKKRNTWPQDENWVVIQKVLEVARKNKIKLDINHKFISNLGVEYTALTNAVSRGDVKSVELLVKAGADIFQVVDSSTSFDLALERKHWQVLYHFLKQDSCSDKINASLLLRLFAGFFDADDERGLDEIKKRFSLLIEEAVDFSQDAIKSLIYSAAEQGNIKSLAWMRKEFDVKEVLEGKKFSNAFLKGIIIQMHCGNYTKLKNLLSYYSPIIKRSETLDELIESKLINHFLDSLSKGRLSGLIDCKREFPELYPKIFSQLKLKDTIQNNLRSYFREKFLIGEFKAPAKFTDDLLTLDPYFNSDDMASIIYGAFNGLDTGIVTNKIDAFRIYFKPIYLQWLEKDAKSLLKYAIKMQNLKLTTYLLLLLGPIPEMAHFDFTSLSEYKGEGIDFLGQALTESFSSCTDKEFLLLKEFIPEEIMSKIIRKNATKDKWLILAARWGSGKVVAWLLDQGIDKHVKSESGKDYIDCLNEALIMFVVLDRYAQMRDLLSFAPCFSLGEKTVSLYSPDEDNYTAVDQLTLKLTSLMHNVKEGSKEKMLQMQDLITHMPSLIFSTGRDEKHSFIIKALLEGHDVFISLIFQDPTLQTASPILKKRLNHVGRLIIDFNGEDKPRFHALSTFMSRVYSLEDHTFNENFFAFLEIEEFLFSLKKLPHLLDESDLITRAYTQLTEHIKEDKMERGDLISLCNETMKQAKEIATRNLRKAAKAPKLLFAHSIYEKLVEESKQLEAISREIAEKRASLSRGNSSCALL